MFRFRGGNRIIGLLIVLSLATPTSLSQKRNGPPSRPIREIPGAESVGSNKCGECHAPEAGFYQATRHHRPFFTGPAGKGCESCHGPGGKHAQTADKSDIVNSEDLRKASPQQRSARCLSCHATNVRPPTGWFLSQHANSEVSCWDCHQEALHHLAPNGKPSQARATTSAGRWPAPGQRPGAGLASFLPDSKEQVTNLFAANRNENCFRCHESQRMEFALPFRHRLERDKMACVDCHDPHGESWRQQVTTHSVENESDALCFRCHAEQRGPFVWQHQAMEEGCTKCHKPHGSVNRRLLTVSGNALCLQCHFERQFPNIGQSNHAFRLGRFARCLDCHIRPHGSNVSEDLTQ